MSNMPAPLPSATAVILRNGSDCIETLLIQRNESMSAFAGAWVFPGGGIEDIDYEGVDGSDPLAVARNAAVRETREETGLVVESATMVPLSHWTTPVILPKRFATWFFIAPVEGEIQVRLDAAESQDFGWLSPNEALGMHAAGDMEIATATLVTLNQLATYRSCLEMELCCTQADIQYFMPRIVKLPEAQYTLLNDDAGYEAEDIGATGKQHRIIHRNGSLHYLNSERS